MWGSVGAILESAYHIPYGLLLIQQPETSFLKSFKFEIIIDSKDIILKYKSDHVTHLLKTFQWLPGVSKALIMTSQELQGSQLFFWSPFFPSTLPFASCTLSVQASTLFTKSTPILGSGCSFCIWLSFQDNHRLHSALFGSGPPSVTPSLVTPIKCTLC